LQLLELGGRDIAAWRRLPLAPIPSLVDVESSMQRIGIVITCGLLSVACDRSGPADGATSDAERPLVGTWRQTGAEGREYVLRADHTFALKMNPAPCSDAASGEVTATGTWSVNLGRLALAVKTSSDPVFRGSTMLDSITQVDATTLVLDSSVVWPGCSGRRVQLSRQP
jgi:hypothetical protein